MIVLKVSLRWGASEKARQMRLIAAWLTPAVLDISQWSSPSRSWTLTPG